jgi:hypothetical protein
LKSESKEIGLEFLESKVRGGKSLEKVREERAAPTLETEKEEGEASSLETVKEDENEGGASTLETVKEEKEELTSEPLLEEIARVNRERKAVKSDDAEVPEYLWEEHLFEGLKCKVWEEEEIVRVRKFTGWLRGRML